MTLEDQIDFDAGNVQWARVYFNDGPCEGHRYVPLISGTDLPEKLSREDLELCHIYWPPGLDAVGYRHKEGTLIYEFDAEPTGDAPGWEGGFAANH